MKLKISIAVLLLFSCLSIINAQNCTDPLLKFLYGAKDPCGYHGGLDLDLEGRTVEDKAESFIKIWESEIVSGTNRGFTFNRTAVKEIGNTVIVKHQLLHNNIPVEDADLNLSFNGDLKLRSYTCQNTATYPRRNQKLGNWNTHSGKTGWLKEYLKVSEVDEVLEQSVYYKISDGLLKPMVDLKWTTNDKKTYTGVIDLESEKMLNEPLRAYNKEQQAKMPSFKNAATQHCGDVIVASGIGCATMTVTVDRTASCSTQQPNYNIVGPSTSGKYEFDSQFGIIPLTPFENSTEDFLSDCNTGGTLYPKANVIYHLTDYYTSSSYISGVPNVLFSVGAGNAGYTVNTSSITFGSLQSDVAEDISFIYSAGLHMHLFESFSLSSVDNLHLGCVDYILYTDTGWTSFFGHAAAPVDQRTLIGSFAYPTQSGSAQAQTWGSALYEIEGVVGQVDALFLVDAILNWMSTSSTQPQAAQELYDIANTEISTGRFTSSQVCDIAAILSAKYPNSTFMGIADFYIADDGADVGNEPNNETNEFWISDDVWNCTTGSSCTSHSNPVYTGPTGTNTMRVKLKNIGCTDIANATGNVRVFMSIAAAYHSFANNDFSAPFGMEVGSPVALSSGTLIGGYYYYDFPYIPFDPGNPIFAGLNHGGEGLHACVRAIIESDDDPMMVPSWDDIQSNNNIVQTNMAIVDMGPIAPPGPGGTVPAHEVTILVKPPVDLVNPHNPNPVLPVGPVPTTIGIDNIGPGDPVKILTETELVVALEPGMYDAWKRGGEKGANFTVRPNRGRNGRVERYDFVVLNERFSIDNILLEAGSANPIHLVLEEKGRTIPFQFDLEIIDPVEECSIGGERVIVKRSRGGITTRESAIKDNLTLSPNPAINEFSIWVSDKVSELQIVDLNGKDLFNLRSDKEQVVKLDVSDYNTGTYLVKVILADGQMEVKKFVKI